MDILDRAKKVLEQSKGLEVGSKEAEEKINLPPRFHFPNRIPKPMIKPEPTELLLNIPDDENIFNRGKKTLEHGLGCLEVDLYEDEQGFYGFKGNNEDCPISIDPKEGELKFYSYEKNLYFNLFSYIYDKFCFDFSKQIKDFEGFIFAETQKEATGHKLFPVKLGKKIENENRFYLFPGKLTGLKPYFDLGSKDKKKFFWALLERVYKTLQQQPEENKEKIKMKYFLNEFKNSSGYPLSACLITTKEYKEIKNQINIYLEKIKNSFGTYRDHQDTIKAEKDRKERIGF